MTEEVEVKNILYTRGYFWWHDTPVPDGCNFPDEAIPGTLTIDSFGKSYLELDGHLSKDPTEFFKFSTDTYKPKNIQGILKGSSKHVFLFKAFHSNGTFVNGGVSEEKYISYDCLLSNQSIPAILEFKRLSVDLSVFKEWFHLKSIHIEGELNEFNLKYKSPDPVEYQIDDGKLTINYKIHGTHPYNIQTDSARWNEAVLINYDFDNTLSLDELKQRYLLVSDLFILLTNSECPLEWPEVYTDIHKSQSTYYFYRSKSNATPPSWNEMWTNFSQIKGKFGNILESFKNASKKFGSGFYLYLGARRGNITYQEHLFVNLIWGLESMHRTIYSEATATIKLQEKISRILNLITSAKDKKWLEGRLKNAHEPSLEERLFQLFEILPFSFGKRELRAFSKSCAESRNAISHFGGQRSVDYSDFIHDLSIKSDALKFLYHSLILHYINVDDDILKSWLYDGYESYKNKRMLSAVHLLNLSS